MHNTISRNFKGRSLKRCLYCHQYYDVNEKHWCQGKRRFFNNRQQRYRKRVKDVDRPLHTKRWHLLRKDIMRSDGGYCQRCWIKYGIKNFQHLEIHHIKPRIRYPQLIFNKNNLITVCHTCNAQLGLGGIDFPWNPRERKVNENIVIG